LKDSSFWATPFTHMLHFPLSLYQDSSFSIAETIRSQMKKKKGRYENIRSEVRNQEKAKSLER